MAQIHEAMMAVMRDIQAIEKGQVNKTQGYKYRGIDDMYNALHDLFAKHGIFLLPVVTESRREERPSKAGGLNIWTILRLQVKLTASDGSEVILVTEGEAMDSGDKSTNKAISAAVKYALITTFLIPTKDAVDADADSPELAAATGKVKEAFNGTEIEPKPKRRGNFKAAQESIDLATTVFKLEEIKVMLNDRIWEGDEKEKLLENINAKIESLAIPENFNAEIGGN